MTKHAKGWMSESERNLTQVAFRFPHDTVEEIDEGATLAGTSKRQFLKDAIHEHVRRLRQRDYVPQDDPGDVQRPAGYRPDPPAHKR
jgi:hypothetical protein